MAKLLFITKKNPRIKKWEHFKLRFRIWLFRANYIMNLIVAIYLANELGYLTNIIRAVSPIWEAVKLKLSL